MTFTVAISSYCVIYRCNVYPMSYGVLRFATYLIDTPLFELFSLFSLVSRVRRPRFFNQVLVRSSKEHLKIWGGGVDVQGVCRNSCRSNTVLSSTREDESISRGTETSWGVRSIAIMTYIWSTHICFPTAYTQYSL